MLFGKFKTRGQGPGKAITIVTEKATGWYRICNDSAEAIEVGNGANKYVIFGNCCLDFEVKGKVRIFQKSKDLQHGRFGRISQTP